MKKQCPECGFVLEGIAQTRCPKCDCIIYTPCDELYFIDIAHHGEDWLKAKKKLTDGISDALLGSFKGLKVIHGYGSEKGHTSYLKNKVITYMKKYAKRHGYRVVSDKYTKGAYIMLF